MPMRIDQGALPAGEPGYARRDGLSNGTTVVLSDMSAGGTSVFEILWVSPEDTTSITSLAPTADDHVWTFSPTPGVTGPIRIRLTHTDPSGEVIVDTRIFGIPDADGEVPPAPGERADPNATLLNKTDPEIIAACERNWRTTEFPDGNPFGWSFDLAGDHALTHVGGSDPIPLATQTSDGLMRKADKVKLDGLEGMVDHAASHIDEDRDFIPLVTHFTPGLMGNVDKQKLDGLGDLGPHQAEHVVGDDQIADATWIVRGLMSKDDKKKLDLLTEPEITLMNINGDVDFTFPNIATYPYGIILAKQSSSGGGKIFFQQPNGDLLIEKGLSIFPQSEPFAYTLYEYRQISVDELILQKTPLVPYYPPPPLPYLFEDGNAEAKPTGKWSVQELLCDDPQKPLFRVRRAADQLQQDIYCNAEGVCDEMALSAFCGTSQGFVTRLYNQEVWYNNKFLAGTNLDFYQDDPDSQPMIYNGTMAIKSGSHVMMQFDGVDDHLIGDHVCGLPAAPVATENYPSMHLIWKPSPAASMPTATPIPVQVAICIGNVSANCMAVGVNDNKLYTLRPGYAASSNAGITRFTTSTDHAYEWGMCLPPIAGNMWRDGGGLTKDFSGSYIINGAQYLDGNMSSIGRTMASEVGMPSAYTDKVSHRHFAGLLSTLVVTLKGTDTTGNATSYWGKLKTWMDLRLATG